MPNSQLDTIPAIVKDTLGNPVPNTPVVWSVMVGGGSVRPLANRTDARGTARAVWTIGPALGEHTLAVRAGTASLQVSITASDGFVATTLTVGGSHTCALTVSGSAYCWGQNSLGQLGLGGLDDVPHRVPQRVAGDGSFTSLVAGAIHTCGLTNGGDVYCWGASFGGQAGPASAGTLAAPVQIPEVAPLTALTAGDHHTCGLTRDGRVYCWGDNALGQMGDGSDRSTAVWLSSSGRPIPREVVGGHRFISLAAGHYTTCAISTDGETYCWGGAYNGELGTEVTGVCRVLASPYYYDVEYLDVPCNTAPTRLKLSSRFSSLAIRGYGHCGVTPGTELVCWGYGLTAPVVVPGVRVSTAWVVSNNVCGLEPSGSITCWGVWSGPGFRVVRPFGDHLTLENFDSSGAHSCGISRVGPRVVYCLGANFYGQLGDGTTAYRDTPAPVLPPRS